MDIGSLKEITREAIYVLIAISTPILLVSLTVGLIISVFQTLTQIQESTLTFAPKIIAIYLSFLVFMPYIISKLSVFTDHVMQYIMK